MKITEIFDLYGQMLYAGYSNQNLQLLKWKILSNIKIKWKILRNRYHIYWNMLSYLLEYDILFIAICHHIYLLLNSNSDKNYIQNITSVKFQGGISPNDSKNIHK